MTNNQMDEAFLQREAEREKQRRRENKHTLFIFWKRVVLRLGIIGIGLLLVGCFAYSITCIRCYQQQGYTKTYVFDNSHLYLSRNMEIDGVSYCESDASLAFMSFISKGDFCAEDQEKLVEAYRYLCDYSHFSTVTITVGPGSIWDPREEIVDVIYDANWRETERETQIALCYLCDRYELPEIHTTREFQEILNIYRGTDFSEVTNSSNDEWFSLIADESYYEREDIYGYSDSIMNTWQEYCIAADEADYGSIPFSKISAEDILKIAEAQREGSFDGIDIDFSQYTEYVD